MVTNIGIIVDILDKSGPARGRFLGTVFLVTLSYQGFLVQNCA